MLLRMPSSGLTKPPSHFLEIIIIANNCMKASASDKLLESTFAILCRQTWPVQQWLNTVEILHKPLRVSWKFGFAYQTHNTKVFFLVLQKLIRFGLISINDNIQCHGTKIAFLKIMFLRKAMLEPTDVKFQERLLTLRQITEKQTCPSSVSSIANISHHFEELVN